MYNTSPLKEEVLDHHPRPTCGKCGKKPMGKYLVGTDNFFRFGKDVHKVGDFPNMKGKDKGSGQGQASGSNVDAPRKNRFYALALGVNKRILLMCDPYITSLLYKSICFT